jgi:hypothetical protein
MMAIPGAAEPSRVAADGRTLFVIGNGPSLKAVDLTRLSSYATLGMNAAYRYWRQIDWRPKYYACLDLVVGLSHRDEIAALIREGRIEKFVLRANLIQSLGDVACDRRVINFDVLQRRHPLLQIPAITTGSHSALWGGLEGYSRIVMLGIDARYTEIVSGAARRNGTELEIVNEGRNPNYFFDGYQKAGDRYNLPNPRPGLHVDAWREAARRLSAAGVDVFNANPESAVQCFPFISLDELLGGGAIASPAPEDIDPGKDSVGENASLPAWRLFIRKARQIASASWKVGAACAAALIVANAGLYFSGAAPSLVVPFVVGSFFFYATIAMILYLRYTVSTYIRAMHGRIIALEQDVNESDRQYRIEAEDRMEKSGRFSGGQDRPAHGAVG